MVIMTPPSKEDIERNIERRQYEEQQWCYKITEKIPQQEQQEIDIKKFYLKQHQKNN